MSARRPFRYAAQVKAELAMAGESWAEDARRWLSDRVARLPYHWSRYLQGEHASRGGVESPEANRWLLEVTERYVVGLVKLSATDDDLRTSAKIAAREARDMVLFGGGGDRLARLAHTCERWGVAPAVAPKEGDQWPACRRMMCDRWWLRRLRSAVTRRCESAAIGAGLVHRGRWCYVSQDTVERRRQQRARQRAAIESAVLEEVATGEQFDLAAVVEGSVACPAIRRGELMTRIRGCDEYAASRGWSCEFWTLTAPSRYHAKTTVGGESRPNPAYGGACPREAQVYLRAVWARARAAWKRRGLEVAGLRTAEPHHDGTPHWHLITYGPARDLRFARRLLRVYALRDTPDEAGARRRRFVVLKAAGGGAAYAAKYVAKNIDGHGMGAETDQESGSSVSSSVERVDAWSAAWRVRQFQFFGNPIVGVWRALRKVPESCAESSAPIEQARVAADAGDWCGYWRASEVGELRLLRESERSVTQYGDLAQARVIGVVEGARRALLTVKEWVIRWGAKRAEAVGMSPLVLCQ